MLEPLRHRWSRAPTGAWVVLTALALACGRSGLDGSSTCLRDGTCACLEKSDCPEGLDCVNGQCASLDLDGGRGGLELGAACSEGAQCRSGHCLPKGPGNGGVCTEVCISGTPCPQGWVCKDSGPGAPRLCVPPIDRLCQVCDKDADCNALGDLCLFVGGERVCGRDCSLAPCPAGYTCQDLSDGAGGVRGRQCAPSVGSCQCSPLTVGLVRSCANKNLFGACYGHQKCQTNATWSACDARTASAEVCDGQDNNCNGLVDAADPAIDVSSLPSPPLYPTCRKGSGGACVGTWSCRAKGGGSFGWVCDAAEPGVEVCNGRDDNCDGQIDEPFVDSAGRYVDVHNCGRCGFDCDTAIPGLPTYSTGQVVAGSVACELRSGAPTCVPRQCGLGYYAAPDTLPTTCLKALSSSCRPCSADADCLLPSDRCVAVGQDPGQYCAQGCDANAPFVGCTGVVGLQGCCPEGFSCRQVAGSKLCLPDSNTCTCGAARSGATRSCLVSAAGQTCVGQEICGSAISGYAWGSCDPSITKELCDYKDNNCNGLVDEGFVSQRGTGTYDTDEHCGSCERNCLAMWNREIQHAIGACDVSGAPTCRIGSCTTATLAGGGACQRDPDCGPGRACHPLYRQCVRACGFLSDCGGDPCVKGFCTKSCATDADCAVLGAPSACVGFSCQVQYQFTDTDRDPTNGCECPAAAGTQDEPDLYAVYPAAGWPYVDRDCDGVDGVAQASLFVWAGSSQSLGTRQYPFRTLREALSAFNPRAHRAILVAAGSYVENVVLSNGVKLYGGYSSDFSARDVVANPTLIEGEEPNYAAPGFRQGTVNAEGITAPTVLAGFTVRGYDVTFRPAPGAAGKSSYAIYVKDSNSELVLANNHVVGGHGGDGAHGAPGGAGQNGGVGSAGRDSAECASASCFGEAQPGGAGGLNPVCVSAGGNPGAAANGNMDPQGYTSSVGGNGLGGYNSRYEHSDPSQSSLCKYDCVVPGTGYSNGGDASTGGDGVLGRAGTGCSGGLGAVQGADWVGGGGGSAGPGSAGRGGGGGGAGGGVVNMNPPGCTVGRRVGDLGATGGGGGAAGCGAQGGGGGGAGGASFGIFVVFRARPSSLPLIQGNLIDTGWGGFGGNGGPGGHGGLGGQGGAGGLAKLPAWCAGGGGNGGRGGNGGAGGGGGGGCGGAAYGLAGNSLANAGYAPLNSFSALPQGAGGSAGAGGASPGGATANGGSAQAGAAATYQEL